MSALFTPQPIEIWAEGPMVVLKVGNVPMKMHYELALKLSAWMRVLGKQAKREAEDKSRSWSCIGVLDDLEASKPPVQSTVADVLNENKIDVAIEGELIALNIGHAEMKLPYEAAIKLSTWIRIRGKQAQRNEGDVSRHWSEIANLEQTMAGEKPW